MSLQPLLSANPAKFNSTAQPSQAENFDDCTFGAPGVCSHVSVGH